MLSTEERIALRPREAAKLLGICTRTLWTWTRAGRVPCVKIGKTVLYPADQLREWLRREVSRQQSPSVEQQQV
jgi:excisionase family DNA binding protein